MKISVLIPSYNSGDTIEATMESVLSQTVPPDEILIMDDGSTDHTFALLSRYKKCAKIFQQPNQGVAHARNVLCQHAQGDLISFLDHDDLWHPEYLATQQRLFKYHPDAVMYFTGHHNFYGIGKYEWQNSEIEEQKPVEVIEPLSFLEAYHRATGQFGSMSFCCIPKEVLKNLGPQPFSPEVSGVDDFHLFHLLILFGAIVYYPEPLVAYRITKGSQSANLLKNIIFAVRAMELVEPQYKKLSMPKLYIAFKKVLAAQRREYSRVLLGGGNTPEAREQLWLSINATSHSSSRLKAAFLLLLSYLPRQFQPRWPSEWKASHITNVTTITGAEVK